MTLALLVAAVVETGTAALLFAGAGVVGGAVTAVTMDDAGSPISESLEAPQAAMATIPSSASGAIRAEAVAFRMGGDCMGVPARIPFEAAGFVSCDRMVPKMRALVEKTIEVIRPALQADGGDIILRDVNEETGVVSVTLIGACGTCPASSQTLKSGIERFMRDRVDGVTEVINIEE